uniref:Uncharacterized protein n=1 Tax=Oryza rufipogon TaxID=4529 RepID=A0A0E0MWN2_ORYRU
MSKCRSSHPTPQCLQWSEPHYSLDIHSTPAFGLCVTLAALLSLTTVDNLLIGFICHLFHIRMLDRTASSIGIQGADVDPNGYAETMGNLKAQGKT